MENNYTKQNRELAIFKMLANANRLKILRLIMAAKSGELNVSEIATQLKLGIPKVSDHLKLLRVNKIVKARQDGQLMFYSVKDAEVKNFLGYKI